MLNFPWSIFADRSRTIWLSILCVLLICCLAGALTRRSERAVHTSSLDKLPPIIVWAWERPEQLHYLKSSRVGIAYLAATLTLTQDQVSVRPRLQPLSVPPNARLIAVARIETDKKLPATLSSAELYEAVQELIRISNRPNVVALQIDFDATLSERSFYRQLLSDVREKLPSGTALSITALASWCRGDTWLEDLPIDEAVPMLFRMGVETNSIRTQLQTEQKFTSPKCQQSAGFATDEPEIQLSQLKRSYFFSPRSWNKQSLTQLLKNHESK